MTGVPAIRLDVSILLISVGYGSVRCPVIPAKNRVPSA